MTKAERECEKCMDRCSACGRHYREARYLRRKLANLRAWVRRWRSGILRYGSVLVCNDDLDAALADKPPTRKVKR